MCKRLLTTLCCVVAFVGCCGLLFFYIPAAHAAKPHTPGTWKQFSYSNIWGSRTYSVYTPADYQVGTAVPMVVMLPGCTQNGAALAALTKMDNLADQKQFIVVYPQQSILANVTLCWNWFAEINEFRGAGEPSIIAGITQTVEQTPSQWTVDTHRVYVAGVSAGAAMAVIMGVTYPDLFAAVGAAAGPEYQAATTPTMYITGGPDPKFIGDLAYKVMGSQARQVPVIDFQGSADIVCPPINGDQVIESWMQTDHDANSAYNASYDHPATTTSGQVPGGHSYTTLTWNDDNGNEVEEQWKVNGMGHAWGGGTGLFGDPKGPDMTQALYKFFARFSE